MPAISDAHFRIQILKELLLDGEASTQDELREALEKKNFSVTQSTISRDLKRVGAIKTVDGQGRTVYRLSDELVMATHVPAPIASSIKDLVLAVRSNGVMIVVRTTPGSASLVARHLDTRESNDILGTLAGDDTVFVAPASVKNIDLTLLKIQESILSEYGRA